MRISDWSSDVCSSDLQGIKFILDGSVQARTGYFTRDYALGSPTGENPWHGHPNIAPDAFRAAAAKVTDRGWQIFAHANGDAAIDMAIERSEEHTSELQSLMRISYAVFCLKKKTTTKKITHIRRL